MYESTAKPNINCVFIQPILTYGCSNLNLRHNDINELKMGQESLIKTALGL